MVKMVGHDTDDLFELKVLFEMDRSYPRVPANGTVRCQPERDRSAKGRNGWNAGLPPF